MKENGYTVLPLWAFMACYGSTFTFWKIKMKTSRVQLTLRHSAMCAAKKHSKLSHYIMLYMNSELNEFFGKNQERIPGIGAALTL